MYRYGRRIQASSWSPFANQLSFSDFIAKDQVQILLAKYSLEQFASDDKGVIVPSMIIRTEELSARLPDVLGALGLSIGVAPSLNSSDSVSPWQDYYDRSSFEVVKKIFKSDIDVGGYESQWPMVALSRNFIGAK